MSKLRWLIAYLQRPPKVLYFQAIFKLARRSVQCTVKPTVRQSGKENDLSWL